MTDLAEPIIIVTAELITGVTGTTVYVCTSSHLTHINIQRERDRHRMLKQALNGDENDRLGRAHNYSNC